jgi:tRNA A37 methylthiotransferase MiaB
MDLQKTIVETRLATLKGTTTTAVLLRQKNASTWIGRTPRQAPEVDGETLIKNVPPTAKAGDFISIVITGGEGYDLHAKACMP